MSVKGRVGVGGSDAPSRNLLSRKLAILLCIGSFCAGMFFTNRMWTVPGAKDLTNTGQKKDRRIAMDHHPKLVMKNESYSIPGEVLKTDIVLQTLERTISKLEMELAAAKAAQDTILNGSPVSESLKIADLAMKRKYLMVIGINTAFNSRKRRDSIRATWMPQGNKRKKLEEEKGIIIHFVIGRSSTSGNILDRAIEAEDSKHGDFLRLEHVEGYMELSAKTKAYFTTAVGLWDAHFYVKVDDDVHVNIGTLGKILAKHRSKPRVYIGCMKSGPVLGQKGLRYHEPEHWKFGGEGNKYFRHATGQLYAISRDLATYISINQIFRGRKQIGTQGMPDTCLTADSRVGSSKERPRRHLSADFSVPTPGALLVRRKGLVRRLTCAYVAFLHRFDYIRIDAHYSVTSRGKEEKGKKEKRRRKREE